MNGKLEEDWISVGGKYARTEKINGKQKYTKEYQLWRDMKKRCCSKRIHGKQPTYKNCTASNLFLNYQLFAEWCNHQEHFNFINYQLDKDILIKGNKHYGENTCVFIPSWLNCFLTKNKARRGDYPIGVDFDSRSNKYQSRLGFYDIIECKKKRKQLGYFKTPTEAFEAYKTAKEEKAKEYAFYLKGNVDQRVVDSLMKYVVEIND